MTSIHAISGLPRSGSTLLAALLRQNPRFSAGVVSPVYNLVIALLDQMNSASEFSAFFDEQRRLSLLRGLFEGCYGSGDDRVAFDTNRMWTGKTELLRALYPNLKIICCVREVGWILNSMERTLRRNPLQTSKLFEFKGGTTLYGRVQSLMNTDYGNVGLPLGAMREAWYGDNADMLVVVRYKSLVREPAAVLAQLYEALNEPPFAHDFAHVEFDAPEYDRLLGMPGLHRVAARVEPSAAPAIVPPEVFARYADLSFWNRPQDNPRGVRVL